MRRSRAQCVLPTDVETEKAKAEFRNGILTIILPKAEQVRPKTINIKARSWSHILFKEEGEEYQFLALF